MAYTKDDLIRILDLYEKTHGKLPTQNELRKEGVTEDPFKRIFGGFKAAKKYWCENTTKRKEFTENLMFVNNGKLVDDINLDKTISKLENYWFAPATIKRNQTTLTIPDMHIAPNQDLSRCIVLNKLILDKKPDNIIFMGDFLTFESLSNWDLNKASIMEGKRYQLDIYSGKEALGLILNNVKSTYNPKIIFLKGNHSNRIDRYLETRPELKEHLNLEKDLKLKEFGIDVVVEYKEFYNIMGVNFTHILMNAANTAPSGKFALHRVSEMTNTSIVYAHSHRKESLNVFRHGMSDIIQILCCGAYFEHVDEYAKGGLNAYSIGVQILSHWKYGRFDVEEFSLERLRQLY